MNKENKHNDIDSFFRSRMLNENIDKNEWNVPSDDLFDNAIKSIEQNDKQRTPWFKLRWLLASFLFILFAGLGILIINQQNEVNTLTQQLNDLNKSLQQKKAIEKEYDHLGSNDLKALDIETTIEAEDLNEIVSNEITGKNKKTKLLAGSFSNKVKFAEPSNSSFSKVLEESKQFNTDNFAGVPVPQMPKFTLEKNQSLLSVLTKNNSIAHSQPVGSLGLTNLNYERIFENKTIQLVEKNTEQTKWSAFVYAGHSLSSFDMRGSGISNVDLTEYDQFYGGWQFAGGVSYDLNKKNFLKFDITYNRTQNHSLYQSVESYDSSNEFINVNGETIYRSDMTIQTPLGIIYDQMEMDVTGQTLSNGEQMTNKTHIHQRLNFLSLNAEISHRLYQLNQFELLVSVGLSLNRMMNCNQDLEISMYHDQDMMGSQNYSYQSIENIRTYFAGSHLGINARKSFANRTFIQIGANYNRFLNSLNQSGDNQTFLHGFSGSLVMGYKF